MPVSLVITFLPTEEVAIPTTTGDVVHACFLDMVRGVDAPAAENLHAPASCKPFTVSPLQGGFSQKDGRVVLSKGTPCWLRFTALDDRIIRLLFEIEREGVSELFLFNNPFEVVLMTTDPRYHSRAGSISYEGMYSRYIPVAEEPPRRIRLSFFSPTTFRQQGRNIPFPIPSLVFNTLSVKWNRYAPIYLGSDVCDAISENLYLSKYELKTRAYNFGSYKQIGFTGYAEYTINPRADAIIARVCHLLADFTFYAGVGYKTTMGMGQVRPLPLLPSSNPGARYGHRVEGNPPITTLPQRGGTSSSLSDDLRRPWPGGG